MSKYLYSEWLEDTGLEFKVDADMYLITYEHTVYDSYQNPKTICTEFNRETGDFVMQYIKRDKADDKE